MTGIVSNAQLIIIIQAYIIIIIQLQWNIHNYYYIYIIILFFLVELDGGFTKPQVKTEIPGPNSKVIVNNNNF